MDNISRKLWGHCVSSQTAQDADLMYCVRDALASEEYKQHGAVLFDMAPPPLDVHLHAQLHAEASKKR